MLESETIEPWTTNGVVLFRLDMDAVSLGSCEREYGGPACWRRDRDKPPGGSAFGSGEHVTAAEPETRRARNEVGSTGSRRWPGAEALRVRRLVVSLLTAPGVAR